VGKIKPPEKPKRSGKGPKKDPKAGVARSGGKPFGSKPSPKPATAKSPARRIVTPLDDARLGSVAGVPSEAQITDGAGPLSSGDCEVFDQIRELLAEHLGSHAAARLWLVTPGAGFETTPLDAIRKGQVKAVLATLESQWGPSPSYA